MYESIIEVNSFNETIPIDEITIDQAEKISPNKVKYIYHSHDMPYSEQLFYILFFFSFFLVILFLTLIYLKNQNFDRERRQNYENLLNH